MQRTTSVADVVTREIMVREWVRRRLGTVSHELRVSRAAQMVFELTQRWHGLTRAEARLLTLGSLVHDVGRSEVDKGHAKVGAAMVLGAGHLPLGEAERRRMAYLTRYHRGRVPEMGAEEYLDLSADDGRVLRMVLGMLRVADALDSRSGNGARLMGTVRGRVMTIYGYVSEDSGMAERVLRKRKKFRLMEEMMGCEVRVEWCSAERMALVG